MKRVVLKSCLVLILLSSLTAYSGIILQEDGPELQEINLPDGAVDDGTGYHEYTPYGLQVEVRWAGFTGQGYINTQNLSGMYVIWEYDAPAAGEYQLQARHALGSSDRDGLVEINGVEAGTLNLQGTGGWDVWAMSNNTVTINLVEGINTIKMTGVTDKGLANIDYIEIIPEPATLALLGLGGLILRKRK